MTIITVEKSQRDTKNKHNVLSWVESWNEERKTDEIQNNMEFS